MSIFGIGILFSAFRTFSISALPQFFDYEHAHLIYLPAGIRLLAIAIYGWIGVLGITLGWVFCNVYGGEKTLLESMFYGFISGSSVYFSLFLWRCLFQVNSNLDSITSRLAVYLVLICAFFSTLVRYAYLFSIDPLTPFFPVFTIGLIGDIVGCFIVLYMIKGGLYLYRQFSKY